MEKQNSQRIVISHPSPSLQAPVSVPRGFILPLYPPRYQYLTSPDGTNGQPGPLASRFGQQEARAINSPPSLFVKLPVSLPKGPVHTYLSLGPVNLLASSCPSGRPGDGFGSRPIGFPKPCLAYHGPCSKPDSITLFECASPFLQAPRGVPPSLPVLPSLTALGAPEPSVLSSHPGFPPSDGRLSPLGLS